MRDAVAVVAEIAKGPGVTGARVMRGTPCLCGFERGGMWSWWSGPTEVAAAERALARLREIVASEGAKP